MKVRRRPARDPEPVRERWTRRRAGILLFALALILRLLFWQATADSAAPYPAVYKGDAPTWLAYAEALHQSRPFELGLPLRPPGNAYLLAALEDAGVGTLRFLWCLLGALTVPLTYGAVLRSFGFRVALVAGLLAAGSTGLMMLSVSLNNETPYLFLAAATLYLWEPLRSSPRAGSLIVWSVLHALACLVRVEHILFFTLVSAYLAVTWARSEASGRKCLQRLGVCLAVFSMVLIPWQLHARDSVRRYNTEPPPLAPVVERAHLQVEAAIAHLRWRPEAIDERHRLPAFCRRSAANFVAATVAIRGGREVRARDFAVLEEAFGSRPEPLSEPAFLVVYGGLNFYLANNPGARGGFGRAPLERPPPLAGGAARYPRTLIAGLPPGDLTFSYPPHLEIVNRGYRLGWDWIREHPRDSLELAGRKLSIFWQGAALGLTGYNVPMGLSGVRRAVDLTVPEGGPVVAAWRLGVLVVTALGVWAGWRPGGRARGALVPWLLFLLSRAAVTVAFFGYARHGATVIPVLALLAGLAAERWIPSRKLGKTAEGHRQAAKNWLRAAALAAMVLVAIEAVRWVSGPVPVLDGKRFGAADPFPADDHVDRRLEMR